MFETNESKDRLGERLLSLSQHILVITFGLLPIFFLPMVSAPFGYTKVFFVIAGISLALLVYAFAALRLGTIRFELPPLLVAFFAVALAMIVAALFSGDMRDAFIGSAFEVHSALFVLLLALSAFVWSVIGVDKAAIVRLYVLLAAGAIILGIFHVLRIVVGADVLSLGVFQSDTISPLGGWNDLALFFGLAVILSLVVLEQLPLTGAGRTLFAVVVITSLVMLSVINFAAVWFVLGFISLLLLVYTLSRDRFSWGDESKRLRSKKSSMVTGAVFVVSALFIVMGPMLGDAVADLTDISYTEVRPSFAATTDLAKSVYQDQALFGVGPNRFSDAWRLHKSDFINTSLFWSTDFFSGVGYIPTFFVTAGLVGGVLWLVFFGFFIYTGYRMFMHAREQDTIWQFIGISSFVSGLYIWGICFIYVPGPTILFLAALCTGLVSASSIVLTRGKVHEYEVTNNKKAGVFFVGGIVMLIISSVATLYFTGRHYSAVVTFNQSLASIQEGTNLNDIEAKTAEAYALSRDDRFARRIAEYQIARMESLLTVQNPTPEQQQQFQSAFANGVSSAETAIAGDPTDPRNWITLGAVYGTLIPAGVEGTLERATEAFTRARELDPKNPERVLQLAQVAYAGGDEERARTLVNESLILKQNYSAAIYFLSQMDIAAGNLPGAIAAARAVANLEPQNAVRHFQLGVLELSNNQSQNAVASFERAVVLDPNYSNARYFLALAYDRVGNVSAAREQLEEVLVLNPDNLEVQELITRLDNGQSLLVEQVGERQPVSDSSVSSDVSGAVTTDAVVDTPLVVPVNAQSGEGAVLDE